MDDVGLDWTDLGEEAHRLPLDQERSLDGRRVRLVVGGIKGLERAAAKAAEYLSGVF